MIRRLLLSLRKSKLGRMGQLVYLSLFAQPLDYVEQPRPVQTKLRNVACLPLLPAGLWASANVSLIQWASLHQLMAAGAADPELPEKWHTAVSITSKGAFVLMFVLVYVVALGRWGKHHGLAWLMSQLRRPTPTLPWSYFLINTTAAALWFSLFAHAIAWCVWKSDGHVSQFLNQLTLNSPLIMVWSMLIVGLVKHVHFRRRQRGMRAFYGKNYTPMLFLDIALVIALFLAFAGVIRLLPSSIY